MNPNDFEKLNVGEGKWFDNRNLLRVPNGWVLSFYDPQRDAITSSVFIPKKI